jgi:hypothetical protein
MLIRLTIKWLILKNFRRIYYKLFGYRRPKFHYKDYIYDINLINKLIYDLIIEGQPFLISRLGATETDISFQFTLIENRLKKRYSNNSLLDGKILAGIFPSNEETFNRFSKVYIDSISRIDIIGTWQDEREEYFLTKLENVVFTSLENLEPFFASAPWTKALVNKKVLIIHPFTNSIIHQLNKKSELLFPDFNDGLLPQTHFELYKPRVTNGIGSHLDEVDWNTALDTMKLEIKEIDFDLAIVAAGAYGLPLGAYIKDLGKQAIHLAGASQLLFGIIGSRWFNNTKYKSMVNSEWIRPLESDVDYNIKSAFENREGAGYW